MQTKPHSKSCLLYTSVYGSYVHGLFDSNEVLQALSKALLKRKDIGTEQKDMISLKMCIRDRNNAF